MTSTSLDSLDANTLAKQHSWQRPSPFVSLWKIGQSDIDHYKHTNNVAYLSRVESLAWEHSHSLGLSFKDYEALDRAMVITQHSLKYHFASHLNDTLLCATWIVMCDKKFRLKREFQFINNDSGRTVFSAQTSFVCVSLKTGLPKPMPDAFKNIYGSAMSEDKSL